MSSDGFRAFVPTKYWPEIDGGNMIEIAIMGYGVVGSGVAEVCRMNRDIISMRAGKSVNIKKILDIRQFPGDPCSDRITQNADEIFNDPEIQVVVETIGGTGIAYELSRKALLSGKHVVTSNKELVAAYGPELMALACEKSVSFMFEASVGGGIPIVRPLHKCLSANKIEKIAGILNGTTNFILTRMEKDGIDFSGALAEAKALGYAEQDPSADVDGYDACRKIAILASITYGQFIDSQLIHTEGITKITTEDMEYSFRLGCKLKLIGRFIRQPDGMAELIVAPMFIPRDHPIAVADDVFNAILVEGNALGESLFYGRGAGKLPTASAVVADVIECVMHIGKLPHLLPWLRSRTPIIKPHGECKVCALIRLDHSIGEPAIQFSFKNTSIEWLDSAAEGEQAIVVGADGKLTESELDSILEAWSGLVRSRIRFY